MDEIEQLETELDLIHTAMCAAYDNEDMKLWKALRKKMEEVGKRYRLLVDGNDEKH